MRKLPRTDVSRLEGEDDRPEEDVPTDGNWKMKFGKKETTGKRRNSG